MMNSHNSFKLALVLTVVALTGCGDPSTSSTTDTGPHWTGTRLMGIAGSDVFANALCRDQNENVYVVGAAWDGLDGNPPSGAPGVFVAKYNSLGIKQWTTQFGDHAAWGDPIASEAVATACDAAGNIYVVGSINWNFDGITLIGRQDVFLMKFDSNGVKQWTHTAGHANSETYGTGISLDASGNIYVAGYAGASLSSVGLPAIGQNFYLLKYDNAGAFVSGAQVNTGSETKIHALATDAAGNSYLAGSTLAGVDGNTPQGFMDMFVYSFDSAGIKRWAIESGVATADSQPQSISTDTAGNVYVAGFTSGGLDGNALNGINDAFLMKLNSAGITQWTKQWGTAANVSWANTVSANGNRVYVGGYTYGGLDGNALTGTSDGFVTAFDGTGTKLWTRQFGATTAGTFATGAVAGAAGDVYLTGTTFGNLDGNLAVGNANYFVSKYNSSGVKF